MLKRFGGLISLLLICGIGIFAQQETDKGRPRRTDNRPAVPAPPRVADDAAPQAKPTPAKRQTGAKTAAARNKNPILATFDALVEGIRNADADAVNAIYADTRQFLLFNYNGTVTRTWEQMSSNRKNAYEQVQNVKLDVRDVKLTMLGKDAALVTCLWSQTQDFRGAPESSTGRMTVLFRLVKGDWKIVHLHTSPENPDPSRLAPSERRTS